MRGVKFRAVQFEPTASKWAGQVCGGVQLHVLDRYTWRPVTAGLHQVAIIRSIYPDDFAWRLPHFDRLMGTDRVRGQLEAGRRWRTLWSAGPQIRPGSRPNAMRF